MKLFRNPEIRKNLLLYGAISVLALLAAWAAGVSLWFAFGMCLIFTMVYLLITWRQYRRISDLAADVDRILHGEDSISLDQYAEGELSLLQSEIYKMIVRLREQQQNLQDDKVYLADSLADISHQIRTPITSINILVSLLAEPKQTEERRGQLTRELYELLSRIDWLITALLKISKLDAGTAVLQKETLPVAAVIERACAPLLIPLELREQTLSVQASGTFTGDSAWTCEAIGNIVKNCMEHTPRGGQINITASENALYTEIVISDTGTGIDPEDLPHIFERFYKGKNSDDKSFGIGLALARMIVSAQNGTIKAENASEQGARFLVRFYKGNV